MSSLPYLVQVLWRACCAPPCTHHDAGILRAGQGVPAVPFTWRASCSGYFIGRQILPIQESTVIQLHLCFWISGILLTITCAPYQPAGLCCLLPICTSLHAAMCLMMLQLAASASAPRTWAAWRCCRTAQHTCPTPHGPFGPAGGLVDPLPSLTSRCD